MFATSLITNILIYLFYYTVTIIGYHLLPRRSPSPATISDADCRQQTPTPATLPSPTNFSANLPALVTFSTPANFSANFSDADVAGDGKEL